jgi:hypothetical protein
MGRRSNKKTSDAIHALQNKSNKKDSDLNYMFKNAKKPDDVIILLDSAKYIDDVNELSNLELAKPGIVKERVTECPIQPNISIKDLSLKPKA